MVEVGVVNRLTVLHELAELVIADAPIGCSEAFHHKSYLLSAQMYGLPTAQCQTTSELCVSV